MFEFHTDKKRYFDYQYRTSKEHIIPFIKDDVDLTKQCKVLEIGCAEAGVLKAFTENNHICTGIELSSSRIELAKKFMADEYKDGRINFIVKDIYDIDIEKDIGYKFDLIILKDVIEHIHNQELFMRQLKTFLVSGGKVFFGFPPWHMPFGGHQQICVNKFLTVLPYFHLLPKSIYKRVLKFFNEPESKVKGLLEIKETGISIERFERIIKNENYTLLKNRFFLTNPIYSYKFNLKTREQFKLVARTKFFRNFVTTCAYYLIEK